jgi:hypothetical protein
MCRLVGPQGTSGCAKYPGMQPRKQVTGLKLLISVSSTERKSCGVRCRSVIWGEADLIPT